MFNWYLLNIAMKQFKSYLVVLKSLMVSLLCCVPYIMKILADQKIHVVISSKITLSVTYENHA